ncbi:probable phosphoglycerate mutase [Persephonella hydrogeniphila]|uniref:Probable phosphoglycerate mutase n=1 Tax=Persephonella hydrogeniphila TaxID=198703 RepID=A0A285NQ57_9AQUI|nr:histidine phosphatase family protein [Persephonella hydrogeniphila]SNZ11605.1 probable phosphoglycerate mutase [Persephonella hydrogeniphila]
MKNIILIRHGESEYNAKRIVQGHIDTDLTPAGIVQARLAAETLKNFPIEKIISSDLKRAYRTATIIGDVLDLAVEKDSRIREMSFGEWEGRSYEHIFQTDYHTFNNWLKNPVACPLPSQEDLKDFENRIKSFYKDLLNREEKNILVVGHGGSIQGILCVACNIGFENLWAFKHSNTGISIIQVSNPQVSIRLINSTSHLDTYRSKENPIM